MLRFYVGALIVALLSAPSLLNRRSRTLYPTAWRRKIKSIRRRERAQGRTATTNIALE
jgi:hypothetical protein